MAATNGTLAVAPHVYKYSENGRYHVRFKAKTLFSSDDKEEAIQMARKFFPDFFPYRDYDGEIAAKSHGRPTRPIKPLPKDFVVPQGAVAIPTDDEPVLISEEDYPLVVGKPWRIYGSENQTYAAYSIWNAEEKKSKVIYMHQVIAEAMGLKAKKGEAIDHINRNRHDNRRENLRVLSNVDNALNRTHYSNTGYPFINQYERFGKTVYRVSANKVNKANIKTLEEAISIAKEAHESRSVIKYEDLPCAVRESNAGKNVSLTKAANILGINVHRLRQLMLLNGIPIRGFYIKKDDLAKFVTNQNWYQEVY